MEVFLLRGFRWEDGEHSHILNFNAYKGKERSGEKNNEK